MADPKPQPIPPDGEDAPQGQSSVTPLEVYYLLERWATLIVWNSDNLEPVGEPKALTLKEANPHFYFYDRGSALVTVPKNLFSHERTLGDALDAARTLATEAYHRGWTVEMAGFEKMVRAFWVKIQHLNDQHGKDLKILYYDPTLHDRTLYLQEFTAAQKSKTQTQS